MQRVTFLVLGTISALACVGSAACDDGPSDEAGGGGAIATTSSSGANGSGGSPATGGTASAGEAGGTAGAGGMPEPDPCTLVEPVCPGAPPTQAGQGLVAIDRCAFALDRAPSFDDFAPLIADLEALAPPASLADVLADLNRTAVPIAASAVPGDPAGVDFAFRWEDVENDKPTWVPQGLTGLPDASADGLIDGKRIAVASFYWKETEAPTVDPKGVRLAFVDISDPQDPKYRFVLLVEPLTAPDGGPDWGIVDIHAGGIAWYGDYLYVAATGHGFRVFDTRKFLRADTSEDVIGCSAGVCQAGLYKYALPQVGAYERATPCPEQPIFSFVALDRSSAPPQLVTGEFCNDAACSGPLAGRVFRYPLDESTGLLASATTTYASDAFFEGEVAVQGAVSTGDTFFMSSSAPSGTVGALYRVTTEGRTAFGWIDTPEDLMIDGSTQQLFSLSEGLGERVVFASDLATFLP